MPYNPYDWYWDNGTDVFSSKTQTRVPYSNAEYQAWLARGNVPTKDPGNGLLRDVLAPYDIGLTPAETAALAQSHADMLTLRDQAVSAIQAINNYLAGADAATAAEVRAEVKNIDIRQRAIIKALYRTIIKIVSRG